MKFDWPDWRRLIATVMTQSLFLSQAFAISLSTTAVAASDNGHLKFSTAAAPQIAHLISPVPPPAGAGNAEGSEGNEGTTGGDPATAKKDSKDEAPKEGLYFKLSPGKPEQTESLLNPVVNAQILSEEETNKLLKLLPPLIAEPAKKFLLPARSLPPPNKQNRIELSFPPPQQKSAPAEVAIQPLKLTSKSPVGSVDQASFISANFSQPMVPVSTQSFLASKTPPVSFTPTVEGTWKWYGTQTLTFEPKSKRLPMATSYAMTVPAGTTSVLGGKLAGTERWTFSTATPQVITHYPAGYSSLPTNTLFMARFNQKVDVAAICALTKIVAAGKSFKAVPVSKEEVAKDKSLKTLMDGAAPGTVVAFKSSEELPYNSQVTVSIGPDIPSAEGPLVTHKSAKFMFRTFGPFNALPQIPEDKTAQPNRPLSIRFSNRIDEKSINLDNIQITPSIPDVKLRAYNDMLSIDGLKTPQTKYQVHLGDNLRDAFGQTISGSLRTLNFNVTHNDKQLIVPSDTTVFSSEQKAKFTITSVNINQVKMNVYTVRPTDYVKFTGSREDFIKQLKPVHSESMKLRNLPDQIVITNVDLGKWLDNNRGSLVVEVTTNEIPYQPEWQSICWVQCTNLGLDAILDNQNVTAWVTDIATGAPVKGARVFFSPDGKPQVTDENGLATVPITGNDIQHVLVATSGKNSAIVGEPYSFNKTETNTAYHWYVVTDRSPYRPGEVISVKGILRKKIVKPSEDLSLPQGFNSVSYIFKDSRQNEIGRGQTDINKFGAFDLSFTLPPNVNLGNVDLNLTAINSRKKGDDTTYTSSITVAEFRRPEFELKVANEGPSVQIVKGSTTIAATTNYFAGGTLGHTDINWLALATSGSYSPPGWEGFEFGKPHFPHFDFRGGYFSGVAIQKDLKSTTDGSGKNYLHIDYLDVHPAEPTSLTISATVQDVNRQTWTDKTTLLVHPSELYVGTKFEKSFTKKGEGVPMSVVVTNIEGKAESDIPVTVEVYRSTNEFVGDKWTETKDDIQKSEVKSGAKPVSIDVKPNLGGLYKIMTAVVDSSGRRNETINQIWVQGGEVRAEVSPDAQFKLQKVLLLPEKKIYQPGDKANILIQSPFAPADGVATVWHDGLAATIPLHMSETSQTITVPVSAVDMPNMTVQVDLAGSDKKTTKMKAAPAEATGSVSLEVSTEDRTLSVVASPDTLTSEPGKEIVVSVDVKNHKGENLSNAEITLAVVDDALLSLVNYRFPDPMKTFYENAGGASGVLREREKLDMTPFLSEAEQEKQRLLNTSTNTTIPRPLMRFATAGQGKFMHKAKASSGAGLVPPPMAAPRGLVGAAVDPAFGQANEVAKDQFQMRAGPQGSDAAYLEPSTPVQIRSNFDALAKWAPSVITDENGHAIIKLKLPDNLTRYRIMAVVSHGENEFGLGESAITARLPLMVKPSAPRFLNYGDKFELPIVLHNQTDAPMEVDLAARATNAQFTKGQGRHATIPANDRIELRLPASTTESGTAKFQVIACTSHDKDAAQFDFPVYTPATTEAFATYGQIENGAIAQSVESPKDVIPDFGSLDLTASTTVLETLTDAFLYLERYPFECSEQIASRIISVALLKDLLKEFHVPGLPSEQECKQTVADDLQKLQSRQQQNGSFGLWKTNERVTYPYVTLHVAHALLLAKQAGYEVSKPVIDKSMDYLKHIDNYISDYKGSARVDIKAQALYVRDLNGDSDINAAHTLLTKQPLDQISSESLGFLLDVFAHKNPDSTDALAIQTYLSNCLVETASTAEVVRNQGNEIIHYDYRLFDSPAKVKAILLDSFIAEGKSTEVVTKLIRSLFGGQVKGRWRNTQENVFVLLAMRHYFDKYEKTVPDLNAEAWLGKDFIGEATFKGRSADFKTISMPMSFVREGASTKDFILKKTGAGRLYYRLGMNYAPKDLKLASMSRGFSVTRTYEGVAKKDDVVKESDGTYKFKAGSLIKVKLRITAPAERFFVALVDPIPGGAEALNEDLNGTETPQPSIDSDPEPTVSGFGWNRWWHFNWWNHENKRDNQTEVFADQLQGGSHEYSYLLRATTPGVFVVPPTKAEEMYAPETFGRAQSEKVVIE